MSQNTFKSKLQSGEPCIGAWLTVPSQVVAEAMATLGFDWMAVDLEHASISTEQTASAFSIANAYGCAPFARIANADPYLARNLLDAGAAGVIVANVISAKEFESFAAHCQLPPEGRRGVALTRANLWGASFDSYMTDFEPVLVAQVESRAGAQAARDIAALPSVDAIFLGPYDLSADLGTPGDFQNEAFLKAIRDVKAACLENGKAAGIHQVAPDLNQLQDKIDEGFGFVAYSTDLIAMRHALNYREGSDD